MKKKEKFSKYQIFGRPMALTIEENAEMWKRSEAFVSSNFEDVYMQRLADLHVVIESAKIYVEANWNKVKDWSDLDVDIVDRTGQVTVYYDHLKKVERSKKLAEEREAKWKEREAKALAEGRKIKRPIAQVDVEGTRANSIFARMDKEREDSHNPIVSFTDLVLDPSDGDLSVTINGRDHLWIDKESVLTIANYIEENLKENGAA